MYKTVAFIFSLFIIVNASYRPANSPAYYGFAPEYPKQPKPYHNQLASHATYAGPSYSPKPSYNIYAQPSTYSSYSEPAYEEKPNPYSFGYKIADGYGNNQFQNEEGDDYGTKKGSYGYTDAYGIYRKVDYIADSYDTSSATVHTSEPGTAPQAPASTKWYAKPQPYVDNQAYASYAPATYVAPVSAYKVPSSAYYAPKYSKPYKK